jgi:hypothetical protein
MLSITEFPITEAHKSINSSLPKSVQFRQVPCNLAKLTTKAAMPQTSSNGQLITQTLPGLVCFGDENFAAYLFCFIP